MSRRERKASLADSALMNEEAQFRVHFHLRQDQPTRKDVNSTRQLRPCFKISILFQVIIGKMIYLNCGETCKDMIIHVFTTSLGVCYSGVIHRKFSNDNSLFPANSLQILQQTFVLIINCPGVLCVLGISSEVRESSFCSFFFVLSNT